MTVRASLVLVADPDTETTDLARRELQRHDLRVVTAASGERALRAAQQQRPDLVVLAMNLPDISGLEVLRRLRARGPLPAVLLTDRTTSPSSVPARTGEALAKPFAGSDLAALVIEALGGRTPRATRIVAGDIEVDLEHRVVHRGGRELSLTRTEWALLAHLAQNEGQTLPSRDILSSVWGPGYRDDLQFLRVWISRLRAKLGGDGFTIATVRGVGYVFQPTEESLPPRPRRGRAPAH